MILMYTQAANLQVQTLGAQLFYLEENGDMDDTASSTTLEPTAVEHLQPDHDTQKLPTTARKQVNYGVGVLVIIIGIILAVLLGGFLYVLIGLTFFF